MGRYRRFQRGKPSSWLSAHVLAFLIVTPFGAVQAASLHQITQADFNSDVSGQPPSTGGLNQPTGIFASSGATILVQSSANGITTQPVVITADAPSEYASVGFVFAPVSNGTLRVEATVAFDRLVDCFFLQTAVSSSAAVVTRLIATSAGEIQDDKTRTTVGHYAANQPFRVRMDVDMTAKSWSVAIDNELDGFDDNPLVSNLPFDNPLFAVPAVGFVGADLSVFPVIHLGASVAYDDISIKWARKAAPCKRLTSHESYSSNASGLLNSQGFPEIPFNDFGNPELSWRWIQRTLSSCAIDQEGRSRQGV